MVENSEGHRETHELRVQADTSPTLVSVISDAWVSRNGRRLCHRELLQGRPYSYQYSELAMYETRQSIARQGFCIRQIDEQITLSMRVNRQSESRSEAKLNEQRLS